MATMGKEAAAAMAAVEAQQQRLTLQRLIAMVGIFFIIRIYGGSLWFCLDLFLESNVEIYDLEFFMDYKG